MLEASLAIIFGLGLLIFGADRFIAGAAATASNFGVPPLLVGLTVVGLATSAPEMLVAVVAALNGNPSMAVGNAIGSNIANIGLVIGTAAVILPMEVHSRVLLREFPIMFACIGVAVILCWDGVLGVSDGVIFFIAMIGMLVAITWIGLADKQRDPLGDEMEQHLAVGMSSPRALGALVVGFGLLLLGSRELVDGAVIIATKFGVSDLVIGLTIVAIGTSLPELAAAIASALKGEPDIALGTVIGSNMFNVLGVLAIPALLHPSTLEPAVMSRDMPVMIGFSIVLFAVSFGRRRDGLITRLAGLGLLAAFAGYQWLLYVTS